jgi:hypothetical protein
MPAEQSNARLFRVCAEYRRLLGENASGILGELSTSSQIVDSKLNYLSIALNKTSANALYPQSSQVIQPLARDKLIDSFQDNSANNRHRFASRNRLRERHECRVTNTACCWFSSRIDDAPHLHCAQGSPTQITGGSRSLLTCCHSRSYDHRHRLIGFPLQAFARFLP